MPGKVKHIGLAVFYIITSVVGIVAAFVLTLEKIHLLTNPSDKASCDFSLIVQCGKNLLSDEGSAFGFPNPLIGLIAWPLVLATGVGLLAGAKYARWYWAIFNVVALGALSFVIWLISESIFDLNTLCPWCMATWSVVIPLFWVSTFWNMKHGVYGAKVRKFGEVMLTWSPTVILASYLTVFIVAQLRLNVLEYIL